MYSENEFLKDEVDISRLLGISIEKYRSLVKLSYNYILEDEVKYVKLRKNFPKIGEIWICNIPILVINDNNTISVHLQKRPVLIIDDKRGLFNKLDNRNYHVLKITSQSDKYMRRYIENWKDFGLNYESYIRIEVPIKIELNQFENKISTLDDKLINSIYKDISNILNISFLSTLKKNLT